jgi:hypothetical protein
MSKQIYFAASGGRIKIGIASNVMSRLKDVGAHLAEPLELLGSIPGDYELEKIVHGRLHEHRLRGEWFRDCAETRHFIADVLTRSHADVVLPRLSPVEKVRRQRSFFAVVAKHAFPTKTAASVRALTGYSESTIYEWLAGRGDAPSSVLMALLGEIARD